MPVGQLILTGWIAVAILMLVLWLVQARTRNAGIVDIAWAFATAILGIYFSLYNDAGHSARQMLLAFIVAIWGLRLGIYLTQRAFIEEEDGRYRYLRSKLGSKVQPFMFVFFQVQALWAVMFALPIWAAARAPGEMLLWNDYAGLILWLACFAGEAIADRQLHQYRRKSSGKQGVCEEGLWRYSRHPNYFFEWMQWWAYVLIGIGSDVWWITWLGVAVMLVFLVKVTGIPYTEQQALRSRGDAYRRYQRTTSGFIPLPKKQITGEPS